MQQTELLHDELVEFAKILYGTQWRDALAKHLNISRKQLVLTLAAGDPIPEYITLPVLEQMELYLHEQEEMQRKLTQRVNEIRGTENEGKQPRVTRKTAS